MPSSTAGSLRALSLASLVALSAACSGGGSSGGTGPGPDPDPGTGTGGTSTTAPNGNHVSLSPTSVSLVSTGSVYAEPQKGVVATFQGAGVAVGLPAGQSKPDWLSVGTPQVLSATSVLFTVYAYPTGLGLAPGRYSCTLRVATADADGKSNVAYTDLPVALTVPQTVSPASFVVGAVAGTGAKLSRTVTVVGDRIAWAASASAPWLSVSPASGTGPASLSVNVDASALAPGEYTGTVTVRDTFANLTRTVVVSLGVDAHALRVSEAGVGLFSIGAKSRLSRSVKVTDSAGVATPWSASSDQTWLAVAGTPGTGTGTLVVTADPTDLSAGMHTALVTVSPSTEGDATLPATLAVGLYVAPAATVPADPVVVPVTLAYAYPYVPDLAADPIRPFVYLSNGEVVQVYNVQTGVLDASVPVTGAKLAAMAVKSDGSTLWVQDSATGTIHPVDLASRTVGTAIAGARVATALAWSPVDGHDVIFTTSREAVDAQSGAIAEFTISSTLGGWESLAASPGGGALFLQNGWIGNHDLARLETHAASGAVVAWQTHVFNEPGDGNGVALSVDGARLYTNSPWHVTSGPTWDGDVYEAGTMALVRHLVEGSDRYLPTADGQLVSLRWNRTGDTTTVSTYGADLTLLSATASVSGSVSRAARSGDDHRLGFLGSASSATRLVFLDRP